MSHNEKLDFEKMVQILADLSKIFVSTSLSSAVLSLPVSRTWAVKEKQQFVRARQMVLMGVQCAVISAKVYWYTTLPPLDGDGGLPYLDSALMCVCNDYSLSAGREAPICRSEVFERKQIV